jgi:hypothetical protein
MAEDGELLTSAKIDINTDELYAVIRDVPEAAQAFSMILSAVQPVQAYLAARQQQREEQNQPEEGQ